MAVTIITQVDLSDFVVSSRDREYLDTASGQPTTGPWSEPTPLTTIETDGSGRVLYPGLDALLVAAAGYIDEDTPAVTITLPVTDGGPTPVRTVEYRVNRTLE
jgi:hypothetical protein